MVKVISASGVASAPGTLVIGVFAGAQPGFGIAACDWLATGIRSIFAADPTFTGAPGELLSVVAGPQPVSIRFVGLGYREELTPNALRNAAMLGARPGIDIVSLLALELPGDAAAVGAVTEGHRFGAWRYGRADTASFTLVSDRADALLAATRGATIARATNWVRELVETPPNILTPALFAGRIESFAAEFADGLVEVVTWDSGTLAERGFGGTLGVGSATGGTALAVELTYSGAPGAAVTALAGKGITFDSGGINLKRDPGEIAWMKSDMAAAASVVAAVVTAAALGSPRALHAVLPITENMPGSLAQRPGDVVVHPDGRTTEVTDTDSEGRLVLADALAWLSATNPACLIDVGTLTDSGSLGTGFWGCWSTSAPLAAALVAAGDRAGDPGWVLPLHDSYRVLLASRVADLANAPLDAPDTGVMAATYLRPFAGDVPWVHIDNGSGAWLKRDFGSIPEGPTGTPVRALIEFLLHRD